MTTTNGRRKSFWKVKFASSSRSRNFMDSWRRLSTAYLAGGGGRGVALEER